MAFGTHLPFPLPRPFTLADTGFSGTSAGVATVTGTLTNEAAGAVELVGSSAGVAAVTGTLLLVKNLSGSSDGVATASGSLFVGPALITTSAGVATVSGTLSVIADLSGSSAGIATVSGDLAYRYLYGASAGVATVSGDLFSGIPGLESGFPIPYPFLGGGRSYDELRSCSSHGRTVVGGTLDIVRVLSTSSTGVASVLGTLFTEAGSGWLASSSTGTSSVSAFLQVGALDGDGDFIVELAGSSAGTATVTHAGVLYWVIDPINQPRFLYQFAQVGVGFEDYDDASTEPNFVSQTFPDGNARDIGDRHLYLLHNIGVGFDSYDDVSGITGFVSQTFPDGNATQDWDRFLYQMVTVLNLDPVSYGTVVINEGYRGNEKMVTDPTPPGQKL